MKSNSETLVKLVLNLIIVNFFFFWVIYIYPILKETKTFIGVVICIGFLIIPITMLMAPYGRKLKEGEVTY